MKLHDVIRTRRQTLGLTQEELARRLGVSAPAVNKWERSIHYPDITLLPSLARVLGVDLNTLLSFQEDMTEEEIGLFLNRIYETAGAEGVAAAFALARDKLREFPNSDLLAYHAAGMLMGVLELQPEDDSPERRAQEAEVTALYERCIRSADGQIREWAAFTLASRCIKTGELDRAEELLGQLSDTHRGKRELTARLRRKQGLHKESWILLEQELFDQAHPSSPPCCPCWTMPWRRKIPSAPVCWPTPPSRPGRSLTCLTMRCCPPPSSWRRRSRTGPRPWSCWTGFCAA